MHYPTDLEWASTLKTQIDGGTLTFADAARDNSDKEDAAKGGDMGWVAKGQLDPQVEAAIFAAPIGKVSDPVKIDGDGVYLFLVTRSRPARRTRRRSRRIETNAFSTWYSDQKDAFKIDRDPAITASDSHELTSARAA